MLVTAPFAGPVSFPLLVAKVYGKLDFELRNSCEYQGIGDVVLDSVTNVTKIGVNYKLVAGVYVDMYSLLGNKESKRIYTVRQGTLADYNARLYALLTGKEVVNTTPERAVEESERGGLALVGIEVRVGESFEEEMGRLGVLAPPCVIYAREGADNVIKAYEEGIRIIREEPKTSVSIISSASKYYSLEIMERIIHIYKHRLTTSREELKKSVEVYSRVLPAVGRLSY
ncbi:MAG: DUF3834 domain-containing protein [Candidatus Aramenus sp.]|jgi:hypothetical protein|nr:DUF3834 domain-containing protein [Candidatus Aramenus sp.]